MIKTKHSLILNRLHQMQMAPCYATTKEELSCAENTILQLERDGYILAMRLLQSDLFQTLDDEQRAAMDMFLLPVETVLL